MTTTVQRNDTEKEVLKMMIDADVTQLMLAEHLGISPQAVNNRLKRESVEPLIEAIEEIDGDDALWKELASS